MQLNPEAVKARMDFAKSVNYDLQLCASEWNIGRSGAANFIRVHSEYEVRKKKPEYENQWMFDLYVLTREEYMRKYNMSKMGYLLRLKYAESLKGEKIPTPERRKKWEDDNDLF